MRRFHLRNGFIAKLRSTSSQNNKFSSSIPIFLSFSANIYVLRLVCLCMNVCVCAWQYFKLHAAAYFTQTYSKNNNYFGWGKYYYYVVILMVGPHWPVWASKNGIEPVATRRSERGERAQLKLWFQLIFFLF